MTRTEEIRNSICGFSREEGYTKQEYLSELLKLQSEFAAVAFGKDSDRKLTDVFDKYSAESAANGNISKAECERFYGDVHTVVDQIKAEISGRKGEYRAFRSLETLMCGHRVLKNVSLMHGDHRTELDAVVLTGKAVFVVEVKNTRKNVRIDSQGNYYRTAQEGEHFDSNIGEKMNDKTYLLKNAFEQAGLQNIRIESLVVFTDYGARVTNDYPYIKTCYLSDLPKIIDTCDGKMLYGNYAFEAMENAVKAAENTDLFRAPVDIEAMKDNFASLVDKIEQAQSNPKIRRAAKLRSFFAKLQRAASAAAMFTVC